MSSDVTGKAEAFPLLPLRLLFYCRARKSTRTHCTSASPPDCRAVPQQAALPSAHSRVPAKTHTRRLLKPAPPSGNTATSCGFGVSFALCFSSCLSHKVFGVTFGFTTCTSTGCETKSPRLLCHQNVERLQVPPTAPLESHLDTAKTPLPEMTYLWKTPRIVLKSKLM